MDDLRNSRRILVIDDNTAAATTLAKLLALEGHQVTIACDGPSGLERVTLDRPEIVFLDIALPDLNGYDVATQIRTRHGQEVTLVALTGFGQIEDKLRAFEAGFDHHLTKPADLATFTALIASIPPRESRESERMNGEGICSDPVRE